MFHNFFKKQGTKRLLAAALSMILVFSSVSPVYATELQEPVTETVTSEAESEVSEAESEVSAAESEAAGSVEASTEVTDEVTSNPYIILLPAYDGITYKYDDAHRDAELSTGEYDILLYEEGETVSFKTKGNIPFKVVDVTEYGEFYDAADGKAEFAMPAKDLTIEFPVEETEADTKNVPDTEVEEDVPDTEKVEDTEPATESEPQTQTPESEEVQTESIPESETATEIETETEIGTEIETETATEIETETETSTEIETETETATEIETETEMETEVETETETETEIETETEVATEIETESETENIVVSEPVTVMPYRIVLGDTTFDSAIDFTNIDFDINKFDIEYVEGIVDINTVGEYETVYRVTDRETGNVVTIIRPVIVEEPVEDEVKSYDIFATAEDYLTMTFDTSSYKAGDEVSFQVTADDGFMVTDVKVSECIESDGVVVTGQEMEIEKVQSVAVEDEAAAVLNDSAKAFAAEDEETNEVLNVSGDVSATYSFTMPESDVNVTANVSSAVLKVSKAADDQPDKFKLNVDKAHICGAPKDLQTSVYASSSYKTVDWKENGETITRVAYCIQPNVDSPDDGTQYNKGEAVELKDGNKMSKALYYLYGGPAWGKDIELDNGKTVNFKKLMEEAGCETADNFYAMTHYVLAYFYMDGEEGGNTWNTNNEFSNVLNADGIKLVKKVASNLANASTPKAQLSNASLTLTEISGGALQSSSTTYKAIDENIARIALPDGVTLVNETTGASGTGTVRIAGGDRFHLVFTPAYAQANVNQTVTLTLNCKFAVDFSAYKLGLKGKQDIGFSYYSGDKTINFSYTVPQVIKAKIEVQKTDGYTGTNKPTSSQYSLAGAQYTIFADAACSQALETMTTNASGYAISTNSYPQGTYYVKETKAPLNYQPDTRVYPAVVNSMTTVRVNSVDQPVRGSFSVQKIFEEAEPDALVNKIDLTQIHFELVYQDQPNVKYPMQLDRNGYKRVDNLLYGNYILKEVKAPPYHKPIEPQRIVINGTNTFQFEALNVRYEGRIYIAKKDIDTGAVIVRDHSTFQILDATGTPLALTVRGDSKKSTSFTTNSMGLVYFDDKIPGGAYTLKEIVPPEGYKIAPPVPFEITADTDPNNPILIKMSDKRVTANVSLKKTDAVSGNPVSKGFSFDIIADEDILDGSGKVYDGFSKGSVIETIHTNESGIATSTRGLYPGKYHIVETTPGNGYLLNKKEVPFEVVEKQNGSEWTAVIEGELDDAGSLTLSDEPLMRPIEVQKVDSVSGNAAGAQFEFQIVADHVVDASGAEREGFENGTVVDTIITDSNGIAASKPLYVGTYIVKETVRGLDYILQTNEYTVEVTDDGKTTLPVVQVIEDEPLKKKVQVTKVDRVTGNACGAGYKFQIVVVEDCVDGSGKVYDGYRAGDIVDTIVTDENGIAISKEHYMGKYYIEEIEVPDTEGMAINPTKYPFELKDETGEDGKPVEIEKNPIIVEIDDIADMPTTFNLKKVDTVEGKNLEGITFRIKPKDAEDADDQLFTTDKDGSIKVEYLKKSTTYTVQEVETIPGYNLEDTVYEFEVDKDGLINGEYSYSITITNQPNEVHILKTDITTGKEIKGASLKITDMKGNVIDEWVSDGTPHVIYELPDGQYRLIETSAPECYEVASAVKQDKLPVVNDDDSQEDSEKPEETGKLEGTEKPDKTEKPEEALPVAETEGNAKPDADADGKEDSGNDLDTTVTEGNKEGIFTIVDSKVVQKVTMEDSPYREVEVSKQEITNSKELPGCTLTIRDAENNVIDTWVSTEETHKVKLHSGLYTLTEEKPADGFVTAETITFEVIQTTASDFMVMPVVMKDEVTKITVSKKDITNSEEIPGAHLTITNEAGEVVAEWTSTQEPHYIERLPIGKYTLTEVTAPENYELAESIEFEIKDTDEIQHYEMFDSPYRDVEISKKDLTNEEEIAGAHMELKESGKDGKLIETWVSDGTPHKVKLPTGKYVLTETRPADGYVTADSITFEVRTAETTGDIEVQKVEMFDDITKVEISKQDVTNEKELPGAKLQIKDKDGNVIEEWTSTDKPHMIEMLPIGTYTLIETTAPKGYEVAEEVKFKVLDTAEIQHVIMYDSPTPEEVPAPQTGDIDMRIALAVIAVIIVLGGAGVVLIRKGKKKDTKDHNEE